MNVKQRQELQELNFCKKYRTDDWDGCKANDYFAGKVKADLGSRTHPIKDMAHIYMIGYVNEMAQNGLFSSCAPLAFSKDDLIKYLENVTINKVWVPKNIEECYINQYREAYFKGVGEILEGIENNQYPFQF